MNPKMSASFNFAIAFEIAKFAKLRLVINSCYTVITVSMYYYESYGLHM